MKNIKLLIEPEDIWQNLKDYWRTDEFKNGMETEGHEINIHCKKVCEYPRIVFEYSDRHIERSHFSSYYNAFAYRKYPNPVVHDVYRYHEDIHTVSMPYDPNVSKHTWMQKMRTNEAEASIFSELIIYFICPTLRKKGFRERIWADRFLENEIPIFKGDEEDIPREFQSLKNQEIFQKDRDWFMEMALRRRFEIMYALSPDQLNDDIERRTRGYDSNNTQFLRIWQESYLEVELQMSIFKHTSKVFGARETAINNLINFLKQSQGEDICPFPSEAREFADVYYKYKDKHNFEMYDTAGYQSMYYRK